MLRSVLAACVLVGAGACVDKAPPAPAVDPAMVADNLLGTPPTDLTRQLDIDLGGKVTYLGYTTGPTRIAPGDKVTITHYWRVDQAPGKNWRVFSHLVGEGSDFVNVDQTDMRKGHPVDHWAVGQIIRDPQTFILRKDWRSPKATLLVGIYKKGGHTIADRMSVAGPNSKDNAVVVITWDVDVSQAAPPPPAPGLVVLRKAASPIVIDGKADDAAWASATSAALVTAESGPDVRGSTTAQLTWDDQYLYAFVSAQDADVWSDYTKNDDPIWKSDVIEMFIDADGNQRGYVELQVSPRNVHFDSFFPGGRAPAGDLSYDAGMKSAVVVHGTLDNRDDDDEGWDVEVAIPLAAVKGLDPTMNVRIPPQPGDTWHLNVVRTDYPRGDKPAAASWNRIRYSDFHSLDRMLTVQFAAAEAPAGGATPPAMPPGGPPLPTIAPAAGSATAPATGSATAPATTPATGSATAPATTPATGSATAPATTPATGSAAGSATVKPPGGATAAGIGSAGSPTSPARRAPRPATAHPVH